MDYSPVWEDPQLIKKFAVITQPESQLIRQQVLVNGAHPEPRNQTHIIKSSFFQININILPSTSGLAGCLFYSGLPTNILHSILILRAHFEPLFMQLHKYISGNWGSKMFALPVSGFERASEKSSENYFSHGDSSASTIKNTEFCRNVM
jgi:hypothetical protein